MPKIKFDLKVRNIIPCILKKTAREMFPGAFDKNTVLHLLRSDKAFLFSDFILREKVHDNPVEQDYSAEFYFKNVHSRFTIFHMKTIVFF